MDLLNALVPAGAALIGTLLGSLIALRATSKQIGFEAKKVRYNAKLTAYSDFLVKYQRFSLAATQSRIEGVTGLSENEIAESTAFASAYSAAVLHAPEKLRTAMEKLYVTACDEAKTGQHPNCAKYFASVVDEMQNDLDASL